LRAAAFPLATSDSNWLRSSTDNRTTNFFFMIGLHPTILVKTDRIGQKSEQFINTRLTRR